MKTLFKLFIILIIFTGCSTSKITMMPEYENLIINDKTLAVASFSSHPKIKNKDDLHDDFGEGNANNIFLDLLKKSFAPSLGKNSTFKEVKFVNYSNEQKLQTVPLFSKNTKLEFQIPETTKPIEFKDFKADYVLFFGQWNVMRFVIHSSMPAQGNFGAASQSIPTLKMDVQFLIWDNVNSKIVLYGETSASESISFFAMTDNTWRGCLNTLSKNIVNDTPFEMEKPSGKMRIINK